MRLSFKRLVMVFVVIVGIGVALPFGCVGNRQFNVAPGDYLRVGATRGGTPFAVAVIEFDDHREVLALHDLWELIFDVDMETVPDLA